MPKRESYRSLYTDLTKIKDNAGLNAASSTADDDALWQLALALSEWAEEYSNRIFAPLVRTLYFDGDNSDELIIPDLVSLTSIKADENQDKTFEVTWASTDYWLMPYNAQPTQPWGKPWTSIKARKKGAKLKFLEGEQSYEIVGAWGYRLYQELSGATINEGATFSSSDTTLTVSDGTKFAVGMTIQIEVEQLLITSIDGNDLTVTRGHNGSAAASHADATAIHIIRWPAPVERAVTIQVARLFTRAPDFQPAHVDSVVDTDVRELLDPYRRMPV
jgi:hypothetical protein